MDLNGDGINDLISGSWPGEIFFFKGLGAGQYDAPIKIKDKSGKAINPGGGVQRSGNNELLIAGDAKFEERDGKQFIVYEGESYEVKAGGGITGMASAVHAVDLDGDGDLDLVIGNIRGDVYVVPNEGSAKEWAFGNAQSLKVNDGTVVHAAGNASPFVADWDGDGKPDLLLGAGDGSVTLYRNSGTVEQRTKLPVYAPGRVLVPAAEPSRYGADASRTPARGGRAKICAADWNGDGKLDLLLGDYTTQKPDRPDPTPEQKARQDKLRAQLSALQPDYTKAMQAYTDAREKGKSKEEREQAQKTFFATMEKMRAIQQKLPPEYESHGWVWLFVRK